MPHITIEYMIMIPILVMQIFLFPLAASWLMNVWVESRRTLALQEAASHLGSIIQQMYFSLNHESVSGAIIQKSDAPPYIENYHYNGTASLTTVLDPALNSSKVLTITLKLAVVGTTVKSSVILGSNVNWIDSVFVSNSVNAYIKAEKYPNGTIYFSFGGGA